MVQYFSGCCVYFYVIASYLNDLSHDFYVATVKKYSQY